MSSQRSRTLSVAVLVAIAIMPLLSQRGSAEDLSVSAAPSRVSPLKIAQTPDADRQRQLQQQREAERVLQEGERLKRDVRENNYYNNYNNNRDLERRVGEQINKVRESGSNPQTVREADTELNRLRQQSPRRPSYYYDPFYYPYYYSTPSIIFTPNYGGIDPGYRVPEIAPRSTELDRTPIGQYDGTSGTSQDNRSRRSNQILGSVGFKDGNISPSIGVRYNTLGFEIGGIFNQDSLPGRVNEFSLPGNFLFNDLGVKKLSPQWGGDLLGFVDVAPRVAVYGSVGIYFQNVARIVQSQATNDLYKQTDDTNVTGAVGGGVTYSPSDDISIGVGYHSLRGLTTRLGISF